MLLKRLSTMLFVTLLLTLSPAWAEVNAEAVARTPQQFYQAVNAKDYAGAWNLLTEASKVRLTTLVAEEAKMPAADIRTMFDTSDKAVCDGFWESFRDSSKPQDFAALPFSYAGEKDGAYAVEVKSPEAADGQPLVLLVKDEGGYKYALAETFKF